MLNRLAACLIVSGPSLGRLGFGNAAKQAARISCAFVSARASPVLQRRAASGRPATMARLRVSRMMPAASVVQLQIVGVLLILLEPPDFRLEPRFEIRGHIESLSDDGTVAFISLPSDQRRGIWKGFPGDVHLVTLAATATTDVNLRNLSIDGENYTYFVDTGPAILSERIENVLIHQGDHAPDCPPLVELNALRRHAVNDRGQVAIQASLNTGLGEGLWAQDEFGEIQLIARMGDDILVGPGDVRRIADRLSFAAPRTNGFDNDGFADSGEIAFRSILLDGTVGIFVSDRVVPIPEPSTGTLSLIVCAFVVLQRLKRRRKCCGTR